MKPKRVSEFLTENEISAVLRVPDRRTLQGKRDYLYFFKRSSNASSTRTLKETPLSIARCLIFLISSEFTLAPNCCRLIVALGLTMRPIINTFMVTCQ